MPATITPVSPIMAISIAALIKQPHPTATDSHHLASELVLPLTPGLALAVAGDHSACDPSTAELFFDDGLPSHRGALRDRKRREAAAKAICALCPIAEQCCAHAHTRPEAFGIWGGQTTTERTRARTSRQGRSRAPQEPSNAASRQRAALAFAHAARRGLAEAAAVFGVSEATLRRVFSIHGLGERWHADPRPCGHRRYPADTATAMHPTVHTTVAASANTNGSADRNGNGNNPTDVIVPDAARRAALAGDRR